MSRDDAARLFEAGAIVAGSVKGDAVDTITARRYDHPALDGRAVVRLVPKGLGTAEDLAMEFLGFVQEAPPIEVGSGRRQALGFPAWALINDPANGHHALALVKDLERLARMARTKPGNAKDAFEELAARLGKAVPHFLPTFFEQAGRSFMAADNKQTAAIMFGRAREAERVHALHIDEDRQRDVFLEFAFSGALTAKSLTQHAKDLAVRAEAHEAYELFLRICLERVAGGLPPYAGMADDLRRLAKLAKLDPAEEDARVVTELLDSPALTQAPLAFWRAYSATLTRLANSDVAVRVQLLGMFPASQQDGVDETWLDLLETTGAVEGLVHVDGVTSLARPHDGAAGWLARAATWRQRGWRGTGRSARMLALVERMTDRLLAEGRPLELVTAVAHKVDLDLLDLCLAAGLDIAEPANLWLLPIDSWMRDPQPGRRDLVALGRADWAAEALLEGMTHALRSRYRGDQQGQMLSVEEVRPVVDNAGARAVLARWLNASPLIWKTVHFRGCRQR